MRFPSLSSLGIPIHKVIIAAQSSRKQFEERIIETTPVTSEPAASPSVKLAKKRSALQPWSIFNDSPKGDRASEPDLSADKREIQVLEKRLLRLKSRDASIRQSLASLYADMQQFLDESEALELSQLPQVQSWADTLKTLMDGLESTLLIEDPLSSSAPVRPLAVFNRNNANSATSPSDWIPSHGIIQSAPSKGKSKSNFESFSIASATGAPEKVAGVLKSSLEGLNKAFQGFFEESGGPAQKAPPITAANKTYQASNLSGSSKYPPTIYDINTSKIAQPKNSSVYPPPPPQAKKTQNLGDPLGATRT
jgi:hypothetical protein